VVRGFEFDGEDRGGFRVLLDEKLGWVRMSGGWVREGGVKDFGDDIETGLRV
jgi:hypothetical protein